MSIGIKHHPAIGACDPVPFTPHVFAGAEGWAALLRALLDLRPFPVFILRPDFRVGVMNHAASSTLAKHGLAISWEGTLRLGNSSADELLTKTLKTLAKRNSPGEPRILPFEPMEGTSRMLRIELLPVSAFGLAGGGIPSLWFEVSLRSSQPCLSVTPERIASTLQLTSAEANLALALADGLSLHQYAARKQIKITTVRWHLQNIFNRTGARSQSGLIRMMASLLA